MRTGVTVAGVLVLILGLVVAGGSAAYSSVAGEWVGGLFSVLGLITGVAGAAAKKQ